MYGSFLPDYVVRLLALEPGAPPLVERVDGVVLFADIVGFTPMSAALAEAGPEGTEELSEILNGFFARMIDLVTGRGGRGQSGRLPPPGHRRADPPRSWRPGRRAPHRDDGLHRIPRPGRRRPRRGRPVAAVRERRRAPHRPLGRPPTPGRPGRQGQRARGGVRRPSPARGPRGARGALLRRAAASAGRAVPGRHDHGSRLVRRGRPARNG